MTRRFAPIVGVILAAACAGKGVSFEEVKAPIDGACARCHDSAGVEAFLADIRALPNAAFTETAFPDAHFPEGLRAKTTAELIAAGDPADDAALDPATAQRKAWILHELHELKGLLAEAVPPDYTSQASFDAFATLGEPGAWEGCEIGEKLDLGYAGDPEGMSPLWAEKLFELLSRPFDQIDNAERQRIRDYVDGLLPGGLRACESEGGGSAS